MNRMSVLFLSIICTVVYALGDTMTGSGVMINRDYIVTASHIVHKRPYTCLYDTADEKCYPVEVVADDPDVDMAIVRLGKKRGSTRLGACDVERDEVSVGTKVYTYGYNDPFGRKDFNQHYMVSRVKDLDAYWGDDRIYRISVELFPGYSGGASFNESGKVVGISRSVSLSEDNVSNIVKSSVIMSFLDDYGIGVYPTTRNASKCTVMLVNSYDRK